MRSPRRWLFDKVAGWLTRNVMPRTHLYSNFDRLLFEIDIGDAVLLEGRTRVSNVIKLVTNSVWTHSALYIGRPIDIRDPELRALIDNIWTGDPSEQLIVEGLLGEGTIIAPIEKYRGEHLRICRPMGLSRQDQGRVIRYALERVGTEYDVRQLVDLLRFLFPYSLMPRRWRSTLFEIHPGQATRHVCSSMMASAFESVRFPILPFIEREPGGEMVLYRRNPRLYTPRDFDYSPYFDVIKYPYLDRGEIEAYRMLDWSEDRIYYNDEADFLAAIRRRGEQPREDGGGTDAGTPGADADDTAAAAPEPAEENEATAKENPSGSGESRDDTRKPPAQRSH